MPFAFDPHVRRPRDLFVIASVRRNLRPEDLGDLLERPFNAIIGIHRVDGSILLAPVWHLFRDGAFSFQVPGGDRKIRMLERDARVSLIVAQQVLGSNPSVGSTPRHLRSGWGSVSLPDDVG